MELLQHYYVTPLQSMSAFLLESYLTKKNFFQPLRSSTSRAMDHLRLTTKKCSRHIFSFVGSGYGMLNNMSGRSWR